MSSDEEILPKNRHSDVEDDDDEPMTGRKKFTKKKNRILMDSDDSDNDVAENEKPKEPISYDDKPEEQSDNDSNAGSEKSSQKPKKSGGKINRSQLLDSSDLDDSDSGTEARGAKMSDAKARPLKSDNSDNDSVPDSDNDAPSRKSYSSGENEGGSRPGSSLGTNKSNKKKGENRQSRKSKDAALQEIYSESNRMLRESKVGLPYHHPRQRTLDEFLNRKKGTPDFIDDLKKLPRIGGNVEDVEKAEKLLMDREKMAEEFFKEEPEVEDESSKNSNEKISEKENVEIEATATDLNKAETLTDQLANLTEEGSNPVNMSKETSTPVVEDSTNQKDAQEFFELPDLSDDEMTSTSKSDLASKSCVEAEPVKTGSTESTELFKTGSDQSTEHVNAGSTKSDTFEEEEDSLRLYLEPDTEKTESEEDMILSSQKQPADTTIDEKTGTFLTKRLASIGARYEIDESILSKKPTINRQETEIVFTDEVDSQEPCGLEHLKNRFVKHVRARKDYTTNACSKKEVISVVRKEVDAEGNVTLKEETFNYNQAEGNLGGVGSKVIDFEEVRRAQKSEKPGAQQVALKLTLKQQIMEDKRKEREEREEQRKLENEEEGGDEEDADAEDDILDDDLETEEEEETDEEEAEEEEEEEEEAVESTQDRRKSRIRSAFLDDEAEEDDDDDKADYKKDDEADFGNLFLESNDDDSLDQVTPKAPGRIMSKIPASSGSALQKLGDTQGSQLTGSSSDIRWTPLGDDTPLCEISDDEPVARKKLGFEGLFDQTDPNPENFDDVIGLCSGQFVTQKPMTDDEDESAENRDGQSQTQGGQQSQTPDTVVLTRELTQNLSVRPDTEKEKTDKGKEDERDTQDTIVMTNEDDKAAPGFMEEYPGFLDSSDSEGEKEGEASQEKSKVFTKKKLKLRRIVISDDENEDSDAENNDAAELDTDAESDVVSDAGERNVFYDSEENEIEGDPEGGAFIGKKGRIRGEFLEREAELSGSEAGSEDEDEDGLDRLMMEEGDLDDVDEDAVRDEVGRLHQRQLLDDDVREVRLLQEAFLEDGELHSDNGRTKKFKWKDTEDGDIENRLTLSGDEGDEDVDNQNEQWRVERLEREKWMQESVTKEGGGDNDDLGHLNDSKFFSTAAKVLKKFDAKPKAIEVSTSGVVQKAKIFKSPKSSSMPLQSLTGNKRGSFLARDDSTLKKLAEMTKGTSASKSGSGPKNSKNFIFAILSPPKAPVEEDEPAVENKEKRKKNAAKNLSEPLSKKIKMDRSIDENSSNTIFGAF